MPDEKRHDRTQNVCAVIPAAPVFCEEQIHGAVFFYALLRGKHWTILTHYGKIQS